MFRVWARSRMPIGVWVAVLRILACCSRDI
jgi:hypothetical protein